MTSTCSTRAATSSSTKSWARISTRATAKTACTLPCGPRMRSPLPSLATSTTGTETVTPYVHAALPASGKASSPASARAPSTSTSSAPASMATRWRRPTPLPATLRRRPAPAPWCGASTTRGRTASGCRAVPLATLSTPRCRSTKSTSAPGAGCRRTATAPLAIGSLPRNWRTT